MRTLSRPMFNMGGPIKQGVMHGIREPKKHGGKMLLVGQHPKEFQDKSGREKHLAPVVAAGGLLSAAGRFLPAAWRGLKATRAFKPWTQNLGKWGRFRDIAFPRKSITSPGWRKTDSTLPVGLRGSMKDRVTKIPGWEKAGYNVGAFMRTNPFTSFGIASAVPQTGLLAGKIAKATPGAVWEGTKRYADLVIPGDQSRWWKEPDAPTGVPLNPNLQMNIPTKKQGKGKGFTADQKAAWAKAQKEKRLNNLLDIMGYDRSKKTAIADALIDASKIVSDRGTLDKKNITGELINPIIQAASARMDKPEQIREAVGLMMAKGEIEKDLYKWKPGTNLKNAQDMAETLGISVQEALKKQSKMASNVGEDIMSWQVTKKSAPTATEIEQLVRNYANANQEEFREVITADQLKGKENVDSIEIVQNLLTGDPEQDDGFYQVDKEVIQVTNGVPKRAW
jgi:hypothetical protein